MIAKIMLMATLALFIQSGGCDDDTATKTDKAASQQQANLTSEAQREVGMPGVTNFTEMKMVRALYELRDKNITTFTYVPDLEGRLWHLCDSIGYGLPYGVQFSNPERRAPNADYVQSGYNIPQAEPNGLFMPPTAEGTWIICADAHGEGKPVYVEPRVVVSPFKLHASGEWQEKP